MGFKYKIDYIEPDGEYYDGRAHMTGDETRLRVFNAKGYELESVSFSGDEVAELLDYIEVWEDHAGTCEVCADYAEKKRRAGNVDPHAEAEVYHNALFQEVQE